MIEAQPVTYLRAKNFLEKIFEKMAKPLTKGRFE
jgi:hypothetical protein